MKPRPQGPVERSGAWCGWRSLFGYEIAYAAQRTDGVAAEFAAQPVYIDFHGIAFDLIAPAIQPVLELSAGQHGAGPLQQRFQNRKFMRRQDHRHPVPLDAMRHRVQGNAAMADAGIAAPRRTAQYRP